MILSMVETETISFTVELGMILSMERVEMIGFMVELGMIDFTPMKRKVLANYWMEEKVVILLYFQGSFRTILYMQLMI